MTMNPKGTPELEALIGSIVYTQCRVDAVVFLLKQKAILVSDEEVDNKCQSLFDLEFSARRQRIIDTIINPDLRATLDE